MKSMFAVFVFVLASFILRYANGWAAYFSYNETIFQALRWTIFIFFTCVSLLPVFSVLNTNFSRIAEDSFGPGVFGFLKASLSFAFILLALDYLPFVIIRTWNNIVAFKLIDFVLHVLWLGGIALGVLIAIRELFKGAFMIKYDYNLFFLSSKFILKSFVFYSMIPTIVVCYYFSVKIKKAISDEDFAQTIMYIAIDAPFIFLLFYLVKKFNEAESVFGPGDAGVSAGSVAEDVADAATERMKDFID